jgi:serine/threonine-protein kinase
VVNLLRRLLGRPGAGPARPAEPAADGGLGRIAHYRLDLLVARGPMSELYAATDLRDGQRRAVKRLCLDGAAAGDEGAHQRFVQEAHTAARLHHPHIVQLVEAGQWEGQAYLAMEFLSGRDLTAYVRPARLLPEPVALQVAGALALALDHAHRLGVVHRDVKPANVVLDLPRRQIKLTDFGIARALDAEGTRSGLVVGTPTYMAPERLAGATAGATADFYALGAVLFELLTGRPPHVGDTLGELLRSIAAHPAPSLRSLRPELPPALDELVAALLERDPRRRLADGPLVAARLAEIEADWPQA